MNKFRHLDVPGHWQQYWTKYPEGYTILEALINWVSQVDLMVDNINDLNERIDEFIETFSENMQEEVRNVLDEWNENGIMAEIINSQLFETLNTRLDNTINSFRNEMNNKIDKIVSPSPVDVVATVAELNSKYPTGRSGVVVVTADGYYYYYNAGWQRGGLYTSPPVYPLVPADGFIKNLNWDDDWRANPSISSLKTGFYSAFIQNKLVNSSYPVAVGFPSSINGNECMIKVFDYGLDGRVDYEVTINWSGQVYQASKDYQGNISEWGLVLKYTEANPLQQRRLTYANGYAISFQNALPDNPEQSATNSLIVKPSQLLAGFYWGGIDAPADGIETRDLPKDIPYGQTFSLIVYASSTGRTTMLLNALYTGISWIGYTSTNGTLVGWKRTDKDVDPLTNDKADFAFTVNSLPAASYKVLAATDTHAQITSVATEVGYVNTEAFKDIDDLDQYVKVNDSTVHLGDWFDGNAPKIETRKSLVKFGSDFFAKPNRFGVVGNHDWNGQWNGNGGNNAEHAGKPEYLFTRQELATYLTPGAQLYYYHDHVAKKIRNIYLFSHDHSLIVGPGTGKYYTDPFAHSAYGKEQVLWLRDTLASVPAGYNVIIYVHEPFDNIFSDSTAYNGDTVRKLTEGYQNKTADTLFSSDITSTSPEWSYFQVDSSFDFRAANGKILAVVSGHRHKDDSIVRAGIRHINLTCSRASGRNYWTKDRNAVSLLEFDLAAQKINIHRFGSGSNKTYNMFS